MSAHEAEDLIHTLAPSLLRRELRLNPYGPGGVLLQAAADVVAVHGFFHDEPAEGEVRALKLGADYPDAFLESCAPHRGLVVSVAGYVTARASPARSRRSAGTAGRSSSSSTTWVRT